MSPDTAAAQQLLDEDGTLELVEQPSEDEWEAVLCDRLKKLGKKAAPLRDWHQELKRKTAEGGDERTRAMEGEYAAMKAVTFAKCRNVDEIFTALGGALDAVRKALPRSDATKGELRGYLYDHAKYGAREALANSRDSNRCFADVKAVGREWHNRKKDKDGRGAGPDKDDDDSGTYDSVNTYAREPAIRAGRPVDPPVKNVALQKWSAKDPNTAVHNRFGKDDNKNSGPLLYEDKQIVAAVAYTKINETRTKLVGEAFEPVTGKKRKTAITEIAADGIKTAAAADGAAAEFTERVQHAVASGNITYSDAEIIIKHVLHDVTQSELAQEYGGSQQAMGKRVKRIAAQLMAADAV
jgi:hypothetical protein